MYSFHGHIFASSAIRYSALLIPSGLGCCYDLANHKDLGKILTEFIEDKSELSISLYLSMLKIVSSVFGSGGH